MRGSTCDFQKGFSIRREPVEGGQREGKPGEGDEGVKKG